MCQHSADFKGETKEETISFMPMSITCAVPKLCETKWDIWTKKHSPQRISLDSGEEDLVLQS